MTEDKSEDLRLDQIGHPKPITLNAMESGRTDRDSDLGDDSPMVSFYSFICTNLKFKNNKRNSIGKYRKFLLFYFNQCKPDYHI